MGAPGCDDAPLVMVPRSTAPKHVTVVYPYYDNADFFRRQLRGWAELPKDLRDHLSFVVVDDGSPRYPLRETVSEELARQIRLRAFRIKVDVRWNWLAARNIGMYHGAESGFRVMTDMDHVITEDVFRGLIFGVHDPNIIYRFSRREHTGKSIHPHPNSWFMTRAMFWKIGGYDEACSGFYGTDGDYRRRCVVAAPIQIMREELVRYEYVGDSSTTTYKRKQPEDKRGREIMRARTRDWKPRTLSFPYEEINPPWR